MLVNHLFLTQTFSMLTDAADVSENSEAFVCLVEDASGKGTLIYNSGTLFLHVIVINKVVFGSSLTFFGSLYSTSV